MSPALIAALPFLGAALPSLLIRTGRNNAAGVSAVITGLALLGLLLHLPTTLAGGVVETRIDWLPWLGLNLNFWIDGLGMLFATMILGIGLLVILYARYYLSNKDPVGQFYTYLLLFQGAMVGIVLSDNILLLLVFWELTSLTSFLLIGYWKHLPAGRQGARMALTVTGLGGLSMIAGMLILGQIAGSYDISEILRHKDAIQASPLYIPALLLILGGAFTKSAQFPFHFWLPHAMAAPTPVSAYLHSATMVKAGLFLMARLWPVLSGTPEWFYIVSTVGLITMLIAAYIAIFKHDMKALLAFSTVSHLGLITFMLGLGTQAGALAAVFHIINHATFKAALFMSAGIVDHEAGTRDLTRVGGLRKLMPITFAISTIAALSMAGIPFFNGFLSKEMMLEAAAHTVWLDNYWIVPAMATLAALLSATYAFRFIHHAFFGEVATDLPKTPHDPPMGMWLSPAFLVVLVLAIGIFPMAVAGPYVQMATNAVVGGGYHMHPLKIWHGFTPALYMSAIAVLGGILFLTAHGPCQRVWDRMPRPEAKVMFDWVVGRVQLGADRLTQGLYTGAMARYLMLFALAAVGAGLYAFSTGSMGPQTRALTPVNGAAVTAWILLLTATMCIVAFHHNRILALVLISIVGLIVSISFVYLSAPDLAMTQISVEVVTAVLMLLALNFLPKVTKIESSRFKISFDVCIAVIGGVAVAGLIYALMTRDFAFPPMSGYMLENSYNLAGGDNVVNVILVDFRGYDTYGEITVLGIAALVIFALTEALLQGASSRKLIAWRPDVARGGDKHPLLLLVATRVMMPIALVVGLFIFLRGHNLPGGGFIAGLIVAIALVMQYMASGFAWTQARQKVYYHVLIASGVLVAGITGAGAFFGGLPFLTSNFGYVKLPGLDKFELATAAGFDLGVFLGVVGSVMLALGGLSRLARRAAMGEHDGEEGAHIAAEKPEARVLAPLSAGPYPPEAKVPRRWWRTARAAREATTAERDAVHANKIKTQEEDH
ncbi:monovalent cation/H+ antiporter subunit A [Thioclava dalianensis]|uniref:Monovalent cation/H+ antiporter subunit A n=1 Tax=Thioclava dalianensis TaxID=1185766 RepID=A0A074TDH4_9RHOB|nr:monovalent cation/H+ antiporter subunit A [Thioclava dalianensis]KEP69821.1 monovalent cation/H+ antiporter subunit A [Thioclava dalianensis]SFM86733.1 multicomponent K+:H+ antiporter subunit A [Thioclava dalianensis]